MSLVAVVSFAIACGGHTTGDCTFCNNRCVDTKTDVFDCGACENTCIVGQACIGGQCTFADEAGFSASCKTKFVACGGKCIDPATDPKNCGGCGFDCGAGFCVDYMCSSAACKPADAPCFADADCCSEQCASDAHCGCMPGGAKGCHDDADCCSATCNASVCD